MHHGKIEKKGIAIKMIDMIVKYVKLKITMVKIQSQTKIGKAKTTVKNAIVRKEEMVKMAREREDIATIKEMDMKGIDLQDQLIILKMIQERNKSLPKNKKKTINQISDQIGILVLLKIKKQEIAAVTEIENIVRKS